MRSAAIAIASASALILAASGARADEDASSTSAKPPAVDKTKTKQARQAKPKVTKSKGSMSGFRAYRDPQTGEIYEPAPGSELKDGSGDVKIKRMIVRPDGSKTAVLSDDSMSDLVAERNGDGKIETRCAPHGAPKVDQPALETR
jgi:hypothetical protein